MKVIGKANGSQIIFNQTDAGTWETTVPANLSGEYAVELYAEDEAGNSSYLCRVLFVIHGHELGVKVLDTGYAGDFMDCLKSASHVQDKYHAHLQEGGYMIEHTICSTRTDGLR